MIFVCFHVLIDADLHVNVALIDGKDNLGHDTVSILYQTLHNICVIQQVIFSSVTNIDKRKYLSIFAIKYGFILVKC